jgi:hypothetical protein
MRHFLVLSNNWCVHTVMVNKIVILPPSRKNHSYSSCLTAGAVSQLKDSSQTVPAANPQLRLPHNVQPPQSPLSQARQSRSRKSIPEYRTEQPVPETTLTTVPDGLLCTLQSQVKVGQRRSAVSHCYPAHWCLELGQGTGCQWSPGARSWTLHPTCCS